ncbi:MAG: amidohydrolase [Anaerolineales bacterium]|jgi:amidohydrolase
MVMPNYLQEAQDLFTYTQSLRRDFHRHPELGFQEVRTAGIVAKTLSELGLEVTTGMAKTGVVATIEGSRPGPVVLLRFDMDALPIEEDTGAEYASQNPGVMHACGHDGHTSIGLTVARLLSAHRGEFAGTVKFVFQPAEEGLGGAELMVTEGVLDNPKPDVSMALHLWNVKPLGWLGIVPGPIMAGSEFFKVIVRGKAGHGALPNLTVDPVLAAAQIITALQSIPARNISPLDSAVISVTCIHGGEAFNVIPSEVELQGTIRTFDPNVRKNVLERFQRVASRVAEAMGCQVEIEKKMLTPVVFNDPRVTARVRDVAERILPESILANDFQSMVSEDMAYLMQDIPGCFILVGSANSEKGLDEPHHHPRFDIDEEALPIGAGLLAAAAFDFLNDWRITS